MPTFGSRRCSCCAAHSGDLPEVRYQANVLPAGRIHRLVSTRHRSRSRSRVSPCSYIHENPGNLQCLEEAYWLDRSVEKHTGRRPRGARGDAITSRSIRPTRQPPFLRGVVERRVFLVANRCEPRPTTVLRLVAARAIYGGRDVDRSTHNQLPAVDWPMLIFAKNSTWEVQDDRTLGNLTRRLHPGKIARVG